MHCLIISPGEKIGPLELGMTQADMECAFPACARNEAFPFQTPTLMKHGRRAPASFAAAT